MDNYEKKYKEALEWARKVMQGKIGFVLDDVLEKFPELKESEDEKIRKAIHIYLDWLDGKKDYAPRGEYTIRDMIAWLEKQGSEPNWCHHKVDLSNCSEEYRKAYYDGWNNCNMQHSQCNAERNDVVKCLINGMKFYYEDNKEAMWGTEKFSMKVKDILNWLEKQGEHSKFNDSIQVGDKVTRNEDGVLVNLSQLNRVAKKDEKQGKQKPADKVEPKFREDDMIIHKELGGDYIHNPHKIIQVDILDKKYRLEGGLVAHFCEQDDYELVEQKPAWSEEDETYLEHCITAVKNYYTDYKGKENPWREELLRWLESLKERYTWKPSDEQMDKK